MINREVARGAILGAIALAFGLKSLSYPMGTIGRMGAGYFPLIVSIMLLLVAVAVLVRSCFVEPVPLVFDVKNIGLMILSILGFAVISQYLNMLLAIVFLVFVSSLAANTYSLVRCAKITAGLFVVAFMLQRLLGVSLPLY
jgi:Tripartite tricarboxylate transporter TctB family